MALPARYSSTQIGLHWLIVVLVVVQLLVAESMTKMVDAADDGISVSNDVTLFAGIHYWVGIAILAIMVVRLGVRLVRGVPPHAGDDASSSVERLGASAVHWALYPALLAAPFLGLVAYYGLADVGDLHALIRPILFVLVGLHIAGALYGQFIRKDGTLNRMFGR